MRLDKEPADDDPSIRGLCKPALGLGFTYANWGFVVKAGTVLWELYCSLFDHMLTKAEKK